jgi:REP element-mobilizing transposase RayT
MNRGARRENIFLDNSSRIGFLNRLATVSERYGINIHGYVLMPNHYHLMAESTRGLLSDCMRDLQAPYVRMQNWLRGEDWDGPLFRERFENRLVYREDHWTYLLAYLHLNPTRARLVMDLDQFDWSSHLVYSGEASCPEWLCIDELLGALGSPDGYLEFIEGVRSKRIRPPADFELVNLTNPADVPAVVPVEIDEDSVRDALGHVMDVTGRSMKQIREKRYGKPGNVARLAAVHFLVESPHVVYEAAGRPFSG